MALDPQHVGQAGQRRRDGVQDGLALGAQDGLLGVEEDGVGDDVDDEAALVDLVARGAGVAGGVSAASILSRAAASSS